MLRYLCRVIGEPVDRLARLHRSTITRIVAFGLAIHIPVTVWGLTGGAIAWRIFGMPTELAVMVGLVCATLIYWVERLVLVTPRTWYVNVVRLAIGMIVAILGASTVDLVIFEREVNQQLRATEEGKLNARYATEVEAQRRAVMAAKLDWDSATAAANCEANGTCGSRRPSTGPIYRELAKQAETRRLDYLAAQRKLDQIDSAWRHAADTARTDPQILEQAGLLGRIEALHQFTSSNKPAFVAWLLLFLLMCLFEAMVILVKLMFGETVDDHLDRVREDVAAHNATEYLEAMTSPLRGIRREIDSAYQ